MQDHPEHSEAANGFFQCIGNGDFTVRMLDTVVFESAYTLESFYEMPRAEIAESLGVIVAEPGIDLPGKELYPEVFSLWVSTRRLSFADAYHLVATKYLGLDRIISFDRGLRGVEGVTRVEPPLD